ncbi:uncharacterized protein LOC110983798 isoform X2 [Acanthaster planci]|uniref:Uncharacterized protein LOC110983798 isoform X2 n=1 Tax=Acanthaster planci TaxID=133434 RepID=A0A8B7Z0C8_ACAPL|nr:uncharacterized protein LOC110983798 isoform X2 [Acanthaster planci]
MAEDRGAFRTGFRRAELLRVQKEIENIKKRSQKEVGLTKEQLKEAEESKQHVIIRELALDFGKKGMPYVRKTEPHFEESFISKPVPVQKQEPGSVPPYNALDKEYTMPPEGKTKKFPYSKEETITTEEMHIPHVQTLGVVPSRSTKEIETLQFRMQGKPAMAKPDSEIKAIEQANLDTYQEPTLSVTARSESAADSAKLKPAEGDLAQQLAGKPSKPAIVAMAGTLAPVKFSQRAKPPARPTSGAKTPDAPRRKIKKQVKSSKKSSKKARSEMTTPWDDLDSEDSPTYLSDDSEDLSRSRSGSKTSYHRKGRSMRHGSAGSSGSHKSASELLAEAQDIVGPDSLPVFKRRQQAKQEKAFEKRGSKLKVAETEKEDTPKERSVDDIISSLKAARETGGVKSEADIKIQQIMQRVLSRTAAVLETEQQVPEGMEQEEGEEELDGAEGEADVSEQDSKTDIKDSVPVITVLESTSQASFGTSDQDAVSVKVEDASKIQASTESLPKADADRLATSDSRITQDAVGAEQATDGHKEVGFKPSVVFQEEPTEIKWEEEMDLQQAWMDLQVPLDVTYEEIMNVEGEPQPLVPRRDVRETARDPGARPTVQSSSVSFLSSCAPQEKVPREERIPDTRPEGYRNSIHHFCTIPAQLPIPGSLQLATRMYHTPSKYAGVAKLAPPSVKEASVFEHSYTQTLRSTSSRSQSSQAASERTTQYAIDQQQRLMSAAAQRILKEAEETAGSDTQTLEAWEKRAQQVFDDEELEIAGQRMPLRQDQSRLYWTPAPPKMDLPSAYIRSTLYPEFQGAIMEDDSDKQTVAAGDRLEEEGASDVGMGGALEEGEEEEKSDAHRPLQPQHRSWEDLTKLGWLKREAAAVAKTPGPAASKEGDREASPSEDEPQQEGEAIMPVTPARSSSGVPSQATDDTISNALIHVKSYTSVSELRRKFSQVTTSTKEERESEEQAIVIEVAHTTDAIDTLPPVRRTQSAPALAAVYDTLILDDDFDTCMQEVLKQQQQIEEAKAALQRGPEEEETEDVIGEALVTMARMTPQSSSPNTSTQKPSSPTLAEKARMAGMKYVLYPKNRGKKKKRPLDPRRLDAIEAFLRQPPRRIHRSESLPKVKMPVPWVLRVPPRVRSRRRGSLPDLLDFDEYVRENRDKDDMDNLREWVRGIWDAWFDEVFPPTEADSESDFEEEVSPTVSPTKRRGSAASSAVSVEIDTTEPIMETEEDREIVEWLHDEVLQLTAIIEKSPKPSPFDLCRRGAMYRKLGKLKQAWEDLNQAILLEPQLLDAYWHRHLLFLLRHKQTKALEDLNTILKINKEHVGAYRSRAEIFSQRGDVTMAIMNYTQTIKLDPEDHEAYYKRAEMYEKRGEMLLALEDYREVTRLMPSKTDAIFKRGIYQFNTNKNWMAAIKDFTELLAQEPANALARTYRGRAYAKHGHFVLAVEDLSSAIHLDPLSSVAFFHRGCLLRRANPKQALQDLSVSVLLDDSEENVMAFFHRAVLYMDDDRYEDAIADFENVLKLDKTIAAAHVNLGLIYMTKVENYHKAIQKFTNAIKVNPIYVRALVCRGEAYHKIHDLKNALLDFTRAIHLRPDQQHYYMYRGEILLEMKNLELASFCVKHAAALSHGLGSSATQQAAVQSFLHNYTKAIDVLSTAARSHPTAPLFILLGKTQIKAKKYRDAVDSLEKALNFMKPWQERQTWPMEAAEVNYLIGMCQTEIPNYLKAFEAFNNAIKINGDYPEAYYQRGLTRMKLRQSKGILDFNRALALNPKLFQAFLSRAAYYGMKGRYSKGIVNCNEAIKLQPNSVRAHLYRGALKYYILAYKLAIKDLCRAIEIDNTCSLAYFNRAVCYHTTKDYGKALRDYGIVLMLGEANALKVLINRGLMYFAQKDYRNAREDFAQAVKMDPRDPKIRHTLGLCCHKLNKLEDAVTVFTSALEVDMFFLDAYIGRGNAFMDYGHEITHQMARRDYERALHLNPQCLPARVNLAYNLQVCGHFQQAWKQLTACLKINPNYRPALEGRAVVCLQMSDTFAAFQDLNAALKLGPSAELYTNRGVVNQFMQDHHNAMRDYQSAVKLDPTYALAYFNAANLYFHNRQFRQAIDFYSKALEHNPKDESAILNRGITKVLMRDARGALKDFQLAVTMSPLSAHVYFNRGNLYASLRRYELAEKDYSEALKLQPDDPLVHKRRAEVRGKIGKRADAVQDYKRAIELQSRRHLTN